MRARSLTPWAPVALLAAACWPVWRWYIARTVDGSDEPWGLLALATAIVFVVLRRRRADGPVRLSVCWVLLGIYMVSFASVPPMIRAALAVMALGSAAGTVALGNVFHPGLSALLALSLPVMSSLQFYLGYPLRLIAAKATCLLVTATGFAAQAEGVSLSWGGRSILVDAPCSGIRMLWLGLYLAATASAFLDLNWKRTACASVAALAAVLLGNATRAAALFYIEAGVISMPSWAHAGVGLVTFAAVTAAVFAAADRMSSRERVCAQLPSTQPCA